MSVDIKELKALCKGLNLLYVEDDTSTRETTYKLLNNFFDDIITAIDGRDALAKFRTQKFDLILSDINMPNLNGLEMLKEIREENEFIPVLMLSAYNDSEYFLKAIELDVDGYILKPVEHNQFIRAIFKIVRKIKAFKISENYQKDLELEVKKRNEEIIHKLHFDPLTNLFF